MRGDPRTGPDRMDAQHAQHICLYTIHMAVCAYVQLQKDNNTERAMVLKAIVGRSVLSWRFWCSIKVLLRKHGGLQAASARCTRD